MAQDLSHRLGSCAVALGTGVAGVIAQATAPADSPSISQIGLTGTVIGASYLIVTVIREGGPVLLKMNDAKARNDRVRLEARLELAEARRKEQHEEDARKIARLEERLAAAEQEARDAKAAVATAKAEVDARTQAIEKRAREAGHMARNNAQRLDFVEKVQASSSGTMPALGPPGDVA